MSKFRSGASAWKDERIADAFAYEGAEYIVQLVARRGTGFPGYRVTLSFIPHDGGDEVQIEMGEAASTADVHRVSRELIEDPSRVRNLFEQSRIK